MNKTPQYKIDRIKKMVREGVDKELISQTLRVSKDTVQKYSPKRRRRETKN